MQFTQTYQRYQGFSLALFSQDSGSRYRTIISLWKYAFNPDASLRTCGEVDLTLKAAGCGLLFVTVTVLLTGAVSGPTKNCSSASEWSYDTKELTVKPYCVAWVQWDNVFWRDRQRMVMREQILLCCTLAFPFGDLIFRRQIQNLQYLLLNCRSFTSIGNAPLLIS
jgi:hypothetical protein